MQLPYLETFSKAAELGSFTGAAKTLGMSQAAVSQRLQALEMALGTSLFERRGGRVLLTDEGRILYDYARRILDLHREVRYKVTGQHIPSTEDLYLGASSIPGEHLLPALLSAFGQKHTNIRIHATISDSMRVMAQVERGEVSLGLTGRRAEKPHLQSRLLASDRLVVIVPSDHPLSKRKEISVKHLTRHPLVLREVGSGTRHCFEKAIEHVGLSIIDLRIALDLGSNEAIKEAVQRGVGIAVLSAYAVQKELKSRQLHLLQINDLHCERDMFIVQDKRRVLPFAARLFLLFLETHPIGHSP